MDSSINRPFGPILNMFWQEYWYNWYIVRICVNNAKRINSYLKLNHVLYDLFIGQASFGPRSAVPGWCQQFACGPPAANESLDMS